MDEEEFRPPFEPESLPSDKGGCVSSFCVSPTNGRLEWLQAKISSTHLNTGTAITDEISSFLLAGDKNPMDTPALLLPVTVGGRGDDFHNVFLQGRSFDRETFDNEVESTVYYAMKDADPQQAATVTIKFVFKNSIVTRPYKVAYQVELPGGDVIENELANV